MHWEGGLWNGKCSTETKGVIEKLEILPFGLLRCIAISRCLAGLDMLMAATLWLSDYGMRNKYVFFWFALWA
jgi:hypothetical protein